MDLSTFVLCSFQIGQPAHSLGYAHLVIDLAQPALQLLAQAVELDLELLALRFAAVQSPLPAARLLLSLLDTQNTLLTRH